MPSVGGLISGMDTNSLIKQLVQLERQPLTNIETRQTSLTRQISTLGTLSSRLGELRNSLKNLSSQDSLIKTSTSSSQEDAITMATTGNAQPASYQVQVQQVAQSAQQRSTSFASADALVEEGTLTIGVWGEDAVEIQVAAGTTLGQLRDQIAASGAQVSASLVNSGTGYFLNLTSKKSGHSTGTDEGIIDPANAGDPADALVVSMNATGPGQALGMTTSRAAQNAKLSIDGLNIESTSNEVNDALAGSRMSLKAATDGVASLDVKVDDEATVSGIEAFVSKFNATVTAIRSYGEQDRGMALRMEQDLREAVRNASSSGTFGSLADIGLTTDYKTGQLTLRKDKLEEAMAKDPEAVAQLFSSEGNGLGSVVDSTIDSYTKSAGVIKNNQDALRGRSKAMDSQVERYERHLASYEKQLKKQFGALEEFMNQMTISSNTFSSYLPTYG